MKKYFLLLIIILSLFIPNCSTINKKVTTIKQTRKTKNYTEEQLRNIVNKWICFYDVEDYSVLIHTVVRLESNYNPNAKDIVAPSASYGLFQLMLPTAKIYSNEIKNVKDLFDPNKNAEAGVAHIKYLIEKYPQLNYEQILQLYNLGERKYFEEHKRNPRYLYNYRIHVIKEIQYRGKLEELS